MVWEIRCDHDHDIPYFDDCKPYQHVPYDTGPPERSKQPSFIKREKLRNAPEISPLQMTLAKSQEIM